MTDISENPVESPQTEIGKTLEKIAEGAKVEKPEAAAQELRAGQNKLTDIIFGLCTGSCAAAYAGFAALAHTELLYKNAEKIRWEPSPEGFATVSGAALAAGTVAYFLPTAARWVKNKIIKLPKSLNWQRWLDQSLRTTGILTAIGVTGIVASLGQYAVTGAPTTVSIPGKKIAAELSDIAIPSEQYCTLLRNMRYVSGIPERGFYISGVTATASPKGADIREILEFKAIAQCEVSTPVGEIIKGRHNIQDKHDAHPQTGEGFFTMNYSANHVLSGKDIATAKYDDNSYDSQRKFGLVHGFTVQSPVSATSTALRQMFGESMPEAVVELSNWTDEPILSSINGNLPELPRGNHLVYATRIGDRLRLRARAEDGTEHDITRFTTPLYKLDDYSKNKLQGILTAAEKFFNGKKE